MDTAVAVAIGTVAVLLYLAAIVFACIQVSRSTQLSDIEKYVWIAAIIVAPLVAALLWGLAGPHPLGLRLSRHPR